MIAINISLQSKKYKKRGKNEERQNTKIKANLVKAKVIITDVNFDNSLRKILPSIKNDYQYTISIKSM